MEGPVGEGMKHLRSILPLLAVLGAAPGLAAEDDRRRALRLAVAAARDVERLLADPELLSIETEEVDVAALVEGFAAHAVAVRVRGRPVVTGDATRLRQAVANLVGNGLRHGSRVLVAVTEEDDRVVIDVEDDGPGVGAVGDAFARGASGVGSTGIGLWLARAIAEAHGGTLELVPPTGGGAAFRLALPSASGAS